VEGELPRQRLEQARRLDGLPSASSASAASRPSAGGDALAFAVAWDNTAGWSDAERWGRLEALRELRPALVRWDGREAPPADLFRALAAGLVRARNLAREACVEDALAGEPALRALVTAALASRPASGQDARSWLVSLDPRWADAATWRELAAAGAVPDELAEVIYVYTGLSRPDAIRFREMLRRDFGARFGAIPLRRVLEPDILRELAEPSRGADGLTGGSARKFGRLLTPALSQKGRQERAAVAQRGPFIVLLDARYNRARQGGDGTCARTSRAAGWWPGTARRTRSTSRAAWCSRTTASSTPAPPMPGLPTATSAPAASW
jgi:hypothetical protein